MRSFRPSTLIKIVVSIALWILILSTFQFVVVIYPFKFHANITPAHLKLPYEEVRFRTEDGLTLRGWFIPARAAKGTIIVTHGYPADKGDLLPLVQFLHPRYNVLLFDFRSFGKSEGRVSTIGYREQQDLRSAISYLKGRGETKIGGLGFSMGAGVLLLVREPSLRGIVVDSAFADLDRMLEATYRYLPGATKVPFVWLTRTYVSLFLKIDIKEISPRRAIADALQPVLIIHGALDRQIPVEHARLLYEATPPGRAELWIIEGANHGETVTKDPEQYQKKVLAFFAKVLE
ncbi:MAG: alpha/beta hydrolase [Candidatus Methylomirabilales bacterium]